MPKKKLRAGMAKCSLCGKRVFGNFLERMTKLRKHRKRDHHEAHKQSITKSLETKSKKGIINPCKRKKNPNDEISKAIEKYTEFHGERPDRAFKIPGMKKPTTLVKLGTLDGVLYDKETDGERYIHRFAEKGGRRPILAASPDGKRLFIIGGNVKVTERGIEG